MTSRPAPLLEPEWLAEPDGDMTVPDVVPDWLLEAPAAVAVEPSCSCGCSLLDSAPEPVRWAVPGVWDDDPAAVPVVGHAVAAVAQAVEALAGTDPALLPADQARVELEALVTAAQRLRVLLLPRLADALERKLSVLTGFRSTKAWLHAVAPDSPAARDLTLARRLGYWPGLRAAVLTGRVTVGAAARVARALLQVRPHLDRPDGLIDHQPGEQVVAAVVDDVVDLVCRDRFGLDQTDPAQAAELAGLQEQTATIHTGGGTQQDQVEQAFTLLAAEISERALPWALEELVLAVVPSLLEDREQAAQEKRALALRPNDDGSWQIEGTLTPECGERLFTVLGAEARRDPANPEDTRLRAEQDQPVQPWQVEARAAFGEPDPQLVPRSRSKRLHDALDRLLARYLEQGLAGRHGKVPVQVAVTMSSDTVDGRAGALPGRGASGRPLARSLLRRWWCDAHVTALVLSQGRIPLGIAHEGRTLTGRERVASAVQFDSRCAGLGCCPGTPDPLIPLVPHHLIRYADTRRTSTNETLWVCPTLHHDLHTGRRTVRLRDGRLVNENGYVDRT
jgi:hypothetical protein